MCNDRWAIIWLEWILVRAPCVEGADTYDKYTALDENTSDPDHRFCGHGIAMTDVGIVNMKPFRILTCASILPFSNFTPMVQFMPYSAGSWR